MSAIPEEFVQDLFALLKDLGAINSYGEILANGKSTHGYCCSCSNCRHHYDDCVCQNNSIVAGIRELLGRYDKP